MSCRFRHSCVGRNPDRRLSYQLLWIPAFAGMTVYYAGMTVYYFSAEA